MWRGSITRYVYDSEDVLLEYDGTNTFMARYSHGDQVDQPLVLQKAGQGFFYYHSNHQGSITHLTDSSGTVANSYVYDSYGRLLTVAELVVQPYSYTGREFDVESELYFYRARYYDPAAGRFLSEDPIGFNGRDQNLYRYVLSNPVNFVDSDGKQAGSSRPSTSGPTMTPGEPGGGGGSPPPGMVDTAGRFEGIGDLSPMKGRKGGQAVAEAAARITSEARAEALMNFLNKSEGSCPVPTERFSSSDENIGPELGNQIMNDAIQDIFGPAGF